ncbi:MAG: phospholipid carrier-dependent glycosyltransferase [Deltaproteobacteria bacterium]|nr:phospholipid carrier-dependent glycosyltransferase [Deltaproteobacteria bacterium]
MMSEKIRARRGEGLLLLLLVAAAAFLYLHGLGARSLWGSEGRWAEIAREMKARSDYRVPRINGTPYRDKPLLSYYMITALTPFTGGKVTETTARLPSALAALTAVFLLYLLGRRLYDPAAALLSSSVLATSFYLVYWGRAASADVITMTGVLLSLLFFVYYENGGRPLWIYLFFLSMAANSLTKGLLGFALPLAVVVPYLILRKEGHTVRNRHLLPALLIAVALYLLPFLIEPATNRSLYLVFRENILRFFAPFDHKEPVYYYLYEIFLIFAPWAFFLPGALLHFCRREKNKSDLLVLLYFSALFLFFTLSGSRRSYYLLPLFPAAALLTGKMWSDRIAQREEKGSLYAELILPGGFLALIFATAAVLLFSPPAFLRPYAVFPLHLHAAAALLAAAGLTTGTVLSLRHRNRAAVILFLLVIASTEIYYNGVLVPEMEGYRGLRPFCRAVNSLEIPRERLAVLHQWRQGNLYFYLKEIPILRIEEPAKAGGFLADPANRLIVEGKDLREIGGRKDLQVLLSEASPPFKKNDRKRFFLVAGRKGTSLK